MSASCGACSPNTDSAWRRGPAGILEPRVAPASSDVLPGFYAGYATVVLLVAVTAVFMGASGLAQATVAIAAFGSGAFGYYTVARGLAGPVAGAMQFARPWLWFTVWAAVGLYDGRYRPLLATAALTVGMSLSHLVGGAIATVRRRR